ncbi:MAG: patatin-like phospholipase family protein [Gammaproteobacteria bacterium]|nr:patatin-like phospholipase family protein [Gammaproteobacteria bacterium]
MNGELIQFLKKCKVFASIENESGLFEALIAQFELVRLKENNVLFRQGDSSDYFYIVYSGKLSAVLTVPNGKSRNIGQILPGETVGELGSLTGEPRTLTVKAHEPAEILRLPDNIFKKLCQQYPSILFDTIHPVITRSRQIIQVLASGDNKKHIAIIPANESVNISVFEEKLTESLLHYKKVILISDTKLDSDNPNKSVNVDKIIQEAEEHNHVILYLLKTTETPLARACSDKIGKIYIVAEGNTKPHFSNFAIEKIHQNKQLIQVRRELILLYKKNAVPLNPQEWLEHANFYMHHNIRSDYDPDYKRLLRFIRGKAVGLVLSGGGAKGWAHIGAIKAIFEAHTPIDAIGGTSAGALVSTLYAYTENYDETLRKFGTLLDATRNIVSFRNICWPAISLFSCEQFTTEAQKIFGKKRIENLWLPTFCTTCNLSQFKEAIHFNGILWELARGTVAVPGIVPPMILNGEMHIDGGVINNLPVNVMRDMLGPESKIIAVELISKGLDNVKYNFPPSLNFREAFLAKLGLGYKDYKFPPFIDTFLQSLLVGSSVKQRENSLAADLLIAPDTANYSMLKVNETEKSALIQLGYQAALEKISTWGLKKSR